MPKSQKALQNSVKWCIVSIGEEELFSSGGEDRAGGGSAPPVDRYRCNISPVNPAVNYRLSQNLG